MITFTLTWWQFLLWLTFLWTCGTLGQWAGGKTGEALSRWAQRRKTRRAQRDTIKVL